VQQHSNITAAHHTGGICLVTSRVFQLRITHRFSIHKYHCTAVSVRAMIVDGEVKGQIHVFLTLAQDGRVWSASCPGWFIPRLSNSHWTEEWLGPRASLHALGMREISCCDHKSNKPSVVHPLLITTLTTLHYRHE